MRDPRPVLTDRESEVLRAVAEGSTNRQAAASLHLSEATVKTHLVHVFSKLGVTSRSAGDGPRGADDSDHRRIFTTFVVSHCVR